MGNYEKGSYQEHLLTQQYRDGSRYTARGYLHARFSTNSYSRLSWLFDHLSAIPADGRILELGCGPGWLWMRNAARIPQGWDITLSDFSSGMLTEAQRNLSNQSHAFNFAVIDAQSIPYADQAFDAVLANHMLYHVPDRVRALGEIRRVLKPQGRLYASTIGATHLQELEQLFPGRGMHAERYAFNLENGSAQLAAFFSHVELYRYDDTLVVTEAEPLIAYLASSTRRATPLDEPTRQDLLRQTQERIATQGPLRLTTDSGLFVAW